jgi:hypothetical protein
MVAFCIIFDLFIAYRYPICDVFHWFCKIARFFATEPEISEKDLNMILAKKETEINRNPPRIDHRRKIKIMFYDPNLTG